MSDDSGSVESNSERRPGSFASGTPGCQKEPLWAPSSPQSPPLYRRCSPKRRASGQALPPSPSPNLIGSYSESLLSGRMSTAPSMPFPFEADLGVIGSSGDETPKHIRLPFDAHFYAMPEEPARAVPASQGLRSFSSSFMDQNFFKPGESSSSPSSASAAQAPYVGTIDIDAHFQREMACCCAAHPSKVEAIPPQVPGYALPRQGQLQLLIKNPELNTPVKLFLVPYDLRDMPAGSKTFIRQSIYLESMSPSWAPSLASKRHSIGPTGASLDHVSRRQVLRYAIHLQFVAVPVKRSRKAGRLSEGSQGTAAAARAFKAQVRRRSDQFVPAMVHTETNCNELAQLYLHKSIRVVFAPRPPDSEEVMRTYVETPAGRTSSAAAPGHTQTAECLDKERRIKYASYEGPSETWQTLRRQVRQSRKDWSRSLHRLPTQAAAMFTPPEPDHVETNAAESFMNQDPDGEHLQPSPTPDSPATSRNLLAEAPWRGEGQLAHSSDYSAKDVHVLESISRDRQLQFTQAQLADEARDTSCTDHSRTYAARCGVPSRTYDSYAFGPGTVGSTSASGGEERPAVGRPGNKSASNHYSNWDAQTPASVSSDFVVDDVYERSEADVDLLSAWHSSLALHRVDSASSMRRQLSRRYSLAASGSSTSNHPNEIDAPSGRLDARQNVASRCRSSSTAGGGARTFVSMTKGEEIRR